MTNERHRDIQRKTQTAGIVVRDERKVLQKSSWKRFTRLVP
jgi:hypothetical protein